MTVGLLAALLLLAGGAAGDSTGADASDDAADAGTRPPAAPALTDSLAGSCRPSEDRQLHLFLLLRERSRAGAEAAVAALDRAGVPGASCTKEGEVVGVASVASLRLLLGGAFSVHCVAGAGNSVGASAVAVELTPPDHVPASLSASMRSLRVDADPKLELTLSLRPCAKLFPR